MTDIENEAQALWARQVEQFPQFIRGGEFEIVITVLDSQLDLILIRIMEQFQKTLLYRFQAKECKLFASIYQKVFYFLILSRADLSGFINSAHPVFKRSVGINRSCMNHDCSR